MFERGRDQAALARLERELKYRTADILKLQLISKHPDLAL